ncbi:MAG: CpaE family protein [Rhodospirillaceae bacterium]
MILRNIAVTIFADTPALAQAAQAAAKDSRLAKCRIELKAGGILEAAQWLATNRSPDVLIVGDAAEADIWQRLERLAETVEPVCKVIVAGRKDSIALYRELLARGISDYLGGDLSAPDLVGAVMRLYAAGDPLPKAKVVATMSASGGAGGSTVAAVLADDLDQRFGDAILVDLDLNMGTAALALGVDVRDPLAEAMTNAGLDAAMLERFVVREHGPKVLSTYGSLRAAAPVDSEMMERAVTIARSLAKVAVVDLPKGWTEAHQRILAAADDIAIVCTPDLASLRNARMILDELNQRRGEGPKAKLILNKAGLARGAEYSGADFREALGAVPTAIVPFDPVPLMSALAAGKPVSTAGGKAAGALRAAAAHVLGKDAPAARKAGAAPASILQRFIPRFA